MPPPCVLQGLSSEQQHHIKQLLSMTVKLNWLSKAGGVRRFADSLGWARGLLDELKVLTKASMKEAFNQDSCDRLMESAYLAVGTGLKQLHLNWPPNLIAAATSSDSSYAHMFLKAVQTMSGLLTAPIYCRTTEWHYRNSKGNEYSMSVNAGKSA